MSVLNNICKSFIEIWLFSLAWIIPTSRNALSVVAFVAASIASGLAVTSFGTWQGGGAWGLVVFAALACVIREWESKDEGYVIEYKDAVETADEEPEAAVEAADEESNLMGK